MYLFCLCVCPFFQVMELEALSSSCHSLRSEVVSLRKAKEDLARELALRAHENGQSQRVTANNQSDKVHPQDWPPSVKSLSLIA